MKQAITLREKRNAFKSKIMNLTAESGLTAGEVIGALELAAHEIKAFCLSEEASRYRGYQLTSHGEVSNKDREEV